jgi:hypothetical protein
MTPAADFETAIAVPASPSPEWTGETIAGFRIHPFASRFPLLQGQPFEELVQSVRDLGIDVPIELHDGLVTDGRNRLRATEVLRERGVDVEVRTVEWQPRDGGTVEEHIFARNVFRRHLTDDQRAVLATELLPIIRAESAARQAATRFGTATGISSPPDHVLEKPSRTHRDKAASSTLGRLAKGASVSEHKMSRAIALADDVAAGLVPSEELEAVIRGDTPLRKAGRKKARRAAVKKKPIKTAVLEDLFESSDDDEADAITLETFIPRWERLKASYPITEHRELRAIALQHIADEQRRYDTR